MSLARFSIFGWFLSQGKAYPLKVSKKEASSETSGATGEHAKRPGDHDSHRKSLLGKPGAGVEKRQRSASHKKLNTSSVASHSSLGGEISDVGVSGQRGRVESSETGKEGIKKKRKRSRSGRAQFGKKGTTKVKEGAERGGRLHAKPGAQDGGSYKDGAEKVNEKTGEKSVEKSKTGRREAGSIENSDGTVRKESGKKSLGQSKREQKEGK